MNGIPPALRKGIMDTRILELALEALESRKTAIDAEISDIRSQMKTGARVVPAKAVAPAGGRRSPRTAAQRKAQAERMREFWRKKRAAAKAKPVKKAAAKPKPAQKSAAAQKASERMKAYWAKKKAEAAKAPAAKKPKAVKPKSGQGKPAAGESAQ